MGLRGPGSERLAAARKRIAKGPKVLPWEKPGQSRLDRVIAFVESCPVTKGIRAGSTMQLLDDQHAFLSDIYGRPEGSPRVRLGIKSAPRGNGKTGLSAAIALCHLLGPEAEARGEVYSAAIDRQQAGLMFAEMEAIIYAVDRSPCG